MRIVRLLIYEGTKEEIAENLAHGFIQPGKKYIPRKGCTIMEDPGTGAGGRVELQEGEIAAIKVVK